MIDPALPPLARALAAATASRLRLESEEQRFVAAFLPAVAAFDDADRAYRKAIEAALPAASSGAILAAMADFRRRVHAIRDRTREQIGEIYRRGGRSYGAFDPLDTYTPPASGLSHADGTRVATIPDRGRSEVDALRADVNVTVMKQLRPEQIEPLIASKRLRRQAFAAALEPALAEAVASHAGITDAERTKLLAQLTELADGWY